MIQFTMIVTIGDGRVVNIETGREMSQYSTARDRLEASRLEMVMKTRAQRFAGRHHEVP